MIDIPYQSKLVKVWNATARCLPKSELLTPDLSQESLIEKARISAGYADFGDETFLAPMSKFLDSLRDANNIHPFGHFYIKAVLSGMLKNRLELNRFWEEHPYVLNTPIETPLVILGMPRSGTSFLFNLLAQDHNHRVLSNWEATVSQVPPEGTYAWEKDPRRKKCKPLMKFQDYLVPHMRKMHQFHLDGPEECTPLLMQQFTTSALVGMFNVPSYSQWLNTASQEDAYKHHKKIIQTLQWKYSKKRWLLKAPAHMDDIKSLLKIYPKACIVHLHRDPVKTIPSYASLCAAFQGLYSKRIDATQLGQQVVSRLTNDLSGYLRDRESCDSNQFVDLPYDDFIKNPIETVQHVYRHFKFEFSAETEKTMNDFLVKDRKQNSSKGKHFYNLESFGLSSDEIRDRFKEYVSVFDIPIEN